MSDQDNEPDVEVTEIDLDGDGVADGVTVTETVSKDVDGDGFDDVVTETDQRELNQKSAPRVEDGLYLVPKVVE